MGQFSGYREQMRKRVEEILSREDAVHGIMLFIAGAYDEGYDDGYEEGHMGKHTENPYREEQA